MAAATAVALARAGKVEALLKGSLRANETLFRRHCPSALSLPVAATVL
jgi:hypothetical protein